MRFVYIIAISISLILFFVYIMLAGRKLKNEIGRSLVIFQIMAFCIVLANLMIAVAPNKTIAMLAHDAYFISMDWFLFVMLLVVRLYTKTWKSINVYALSTVIVLDSLNILSNHIFHHCYELVEYRTDAGELFYQLVQKEFYVVHLVLCYIIALITMGVLIYSALRIPKIYSIRYWMLVVGFLVVLIVDGIYLLLKQPLDWSVVSYVIFVIATIEISVKYVPRRLLASMQSTVAKEINTGLLIYDMDENCMFANDFVCNYFGESLESLQGPEGRIAQCLEGHSLEEFAGKEMSGEFTKDDSKQYYKLSVERCKDNTDHIIGYSVMIQDISEEVNHAAHDHYRATRDALTGIYNRAYFFERAAEILKEHHYQDYMLVCSDIKNFKVLGELYGEKVADNTLKNFATFIRANVTSNHVVYGRLGADQFGVFLPKKSYSEELFQRLGKAVMEPVNEGRQLKFRCKMGVYEVTEELPISGMCDRAQLAIAQIKNDYSTSLAYYNEQLKDRVIQEYEMNATLDEAIKNKEICIYIQPQVDSEGRTLGGECLVRWKHPKKGLISPGVFIPVFERNGRIADLDRAIWRQACEKLSEWEKIGRVDQHLSINISPRDVILLDVYQELTTLVNEYEIDPKLLKLEITESVVVEDIERVTELIEKLHGFGFEVEMDDFGSGYSSLNVLKDIPVDVLKVDMMFLQKTKYVEKSRIILESVVSLAKKMKLDVLVEGVESYEQVKFLTEIGCTKFQGYYFAKPLSVAEFEQRVNIQ